MRRILASLLLVVAVAACGGEPEITTQGLVRIMPASGDAPAGTEYREEQSGARGLQEFASDEEVRAKLGSFGFRGARTATYASPGLPADLATAPTGSALYGAFGIVFVDAKFARQGFSYYAERLRTRAIGYTPLLVETLGAESVAFRFSQLQDTPLPGIAYVWRFGNALFGVVGVGNPVPEPSAVRAVAAEMDSQARGEG